MTLEDYLVSWIGFFDAAFVYYVLQLGRAVLISSVMLAVIVFLRKTVFRNAIFLRGVIWSILLLAPVMGKMKCIYETRLGIRLLYPWQIICVNYRWVPCAYITGMSAMGVFIFRKRRRLKHAVKDLEKVKFKGTEIAVSRLAVSPFTTGLIRPTIVVPEVMLESLSDAELKMILLHERVHIRLGHLWCFLMWDILRVLLWANPFLHICTKWFREDIEDICDRVTMQRGDQNAYAYGSLLLKSIQMLKNENKELEFSAAFAAEKQYMNVKHRLERVVAFKPYNQLKAGILAAVCGLFLVIMFTLVIHISYPRYTDYDMVQIYNRKGTELLVADSDALREAVRIGSDKIYIDREKLDCIFARQGIEEDMFFLYFGGFSKLPGVGGGGDGIFVEYWEQDGDLVLPYVSNDKDFKTWLFKHL